MSSLHLKIITKNTNTHIHIYYMYMCTNIHTRLCLCTSTPIYYIHMYTKICESRGKIILWQMFAVLVIF